MYSININLVPEIYCGVAYYFWCIFEKHNEQFINCGHGWAKSIHEAFEDSQKYYLEHFSSKTECF